MPLNWEYESALNIAKNPRQWNEAALRKALHTLRQCSHWDAAKQGIMKIEAWLDAL